MFIVSRRQRCKKRWLLLRSVLFHVINSSVHFFCFTSSLPSLRTLRSDIDPTFLIVSVRRNDPRFPFFRIIRPLYPCSVHDSSRSQIVVLSHVYSSIIGSSVAVWRVFLVSLSLSVTLQCLSVSVVVLLYLFLSTSIHTECRHSWVRAKGSICATSIVLFLWRTLCRTAHVRMVFTVRIRNLRTFTSSNMRWTLYISPWNKSERTSWRQISRTWDDWHDSISCKNEKTTRCRFVQKKIVQAWQQST